MKGRIQDHSTFCVQLLTREKLVSSEYATVTLKNMYYIQHITVYETTKDSYVKSAEKRGLDKILQ